jgi:hypothetical protein
MPCVGDEIRCERTARLLVARLETLARATSGLPYGEAERLVELASVATKRAVALELMQADEADEIWRDAHLRHPQLPRVEIELPARRAA